MCRQIKDETDGTNIEKDSKCKPGGTRTLAGVAAVPHCHGGSFAGIYVSYNSSNGTLRVLCGLLHGVSIAP